MKKKNVALPGSLFVLSASSGVGKTTVARQIIEKAHQDGLALEQVITYTTRLPRKDEIDGKHYYFVSVSAFKKKIDEGFFIEWSDAYGTYYGSPKTILPILERGTSLLVILDQQGALRVHSLYAKTVLVWLESPDLRILEQRLHARKSESEDGKQFRIGLAKKENNSSVLEQYHYRLTSNSLPKIVDTLFNLIRGTISDSQDGK